jgi:hypothetical protein
MYSPHAACCTAVAVRTDSLFAAVQCWQQDNAPHLLSLVLDQSSPLYKQHMISDYAVKASTHLPQRYATSSPTSIRTAPAAQNKLHPC